MEKNDVLTVMFTLKIMQFQYNFMLIIIVLNFELLNFPKNSLIYLQFIIGLRISND